jgi:hypothetical protein
LVKKSSLLAVMSVMMVVLPALMPDPAVAVPVPWIDNGAGDHDGGSDGDRRRYDRGDVGGSHISLLIGDADRTDMNLHADWRLRLG